MKNFHRRLAAALLSAALLATVLPAGALAEEPEALPQANAEPVCTCTIPCTEETRNAECAVCGADGAALEVCAAANAADTQTEEDTPAQEEDAVALLGVQDGVAYVDETGAEQTQDGVAEVTAEDTTWGTGWYVVDDWVNLQNRVMVDGDVRLILADGGYLDAMKGVRVGDGSSLTIYAQEGGTGSLSARSSTIVDAAIGGNANENGGAIYIHGGTVRARNDELGFGESDGVAAGIGGGANGDGGTICITGGNVTANGSWNDMGSEHMLVSAGIGGGSNGGSGRITITGGKITAGSGGSGAAAIGSGSGGPEGSISITGGDFSSGDLTQNTVCGVAVAEGLFVILKTEDGSSWYHVTDQVGEVDILGGTADVDYTRVDGVITILTDTPLTISGNGLTSKERIVIAGGISADLTVKNMEIYTESAPLEISDGSALELTLAGENQLTASDSAGILNRGALTINGSGTLDVQGDYSCAGIETTDGTLVVDSGTIFATGGYNGAGIGGGRGRSGGTITINGGTVTAAGQERAAGIGGGMGGPGGTITINGGTVTALGGYWGAGIGGGGGEPYGNNAGDGGTIEIHGGTVAAVGGSNSGAGIGGGGGSGRGGIYGGVAGNGGSITITGGTVQASANRGAGIGGGGNTTDSPAADLCGAGGVITITGGVVQASSEKGAGIGGGIAPNGSNGVTVPDGSVIQTGNGPAITVSGEGTAVTPSGEVTLPGNGSAVIAGSQGNTTVIVPEDGGVLTPHDDGSVTLPGGSTVQTGDQTVAIPDGGGTIQPDGEIRYTVTVTFDSQGGSAVTAQKIMAGSLLTQPEQPTRSGYRFTGWYQDAACTVAWSFADMPVTSDLTLYAGWKKTSSGGSSGGSGGSTGNSGSENETSGGQAAQNNPFTDVAEDAYYHDAVLWAVENGITAGLTETMFGPDQACTRAQIVTFLWRAAGSPAPIATENPFKDVAEGAYYYDAVLWAAEQGITGGTGAGTFRPNATVTRAQTVTFLYRAAGSPAVSGSGFADVAADAYYADAVAWAADQGITSGTTAETFSPAQACTRAQIVTFLYRDRT